MYRGILLGIAVLLASCTTTAKLSLDTETTEKLVTLDFMSTYCIELGASPEVYHDYRQTASKVLAIAELDSETYKETYSALVTKYNQGTKEEISEGCNKSVNSVMRVAQILEEAYPEMLARLTAQQQQEAEAWANAITFLSQAATVTGNAVQQSTQPAYIPMPSGKVTYTNPANTGSSYNHYLIQTPTGQKQCHVSNSGYIFCN